MLKPFICLILLPPAVALAGCAAHLPPSPPLSPADPQRAEAGHAPLRPRLVTTARTFVPPEAGARARQMKKVPATGADLHHANKSVSYTCLMHPEIQQDEPGSCPICAMTLVEKYESEGNNP